MWALTEQLEDVLNTSIESIRILHCSLNFRSNYPSINSTIFYKTMGKVQINAFTRLNRSNEISIFSYIHVAI